MALDINALYGSLTDNELAGLSAAREMGTAFPITRGGTVYNFLPDGNIETTTPNDMEGGRTGATLGLFSGTGEAIVDPYYNASFGETSGSQMFGRALLGAALGGMLGPAGFGLATPAAAATSAGLTTFSSTGELEDALRAAALAGTATYGLGELFPTGAVANTDAAFIAADAAQLAAQGLSESQINTVLQAAGVAPSIAGNVAVAAAEGLNPQQIINEIGTIRFTPPSNVPTTAPTVATETLQPSLTGTTQPITITGSTLPSTVGSLGTLAAVAPTLSQVVSLSPAPAPAPAPNTRSETDTQSISITGTNLPGTTNITPVIPFVPTLPVPPVPPLVPTLPPVAPPPTTQTVDVTAPRVTDTGIPPLSVVTPLPVPPIPPLVPPTPPATPTPPAPPPTSPTSPVSVADIIKLLGLLGVGSAGTGLLGGGTTPTISTPPSDTMLGSTTPQFGPDYYAAVQQYYNAYMPETPRNVAGPLQQWYENKYGA